MPLVSLLLNILIACGRNDIVVHIADIYPVCNIFLVGFSYFIIISFICIYLSLFFSTTPEYLAISK